MEYQFLKYLNKEELNGLENILLGKIDKEELLAQISMQKNNSITLNDNFSSSYIPYYDPRLESKCNKLLKELSLNDLFFFATTFSEKGNTKKVGRDSSTFPNELVIKMRDYDIDGCLLKRKVEYPWAWFSCWQDCDAASITLDKIDNMFKNNIFSNKYEGTYNMFNYIKNYIYLLLKQKSSIEKRDVFLDFLEKKSLVHLQLRDISSYLCSIKDGTNLRLCISNLGLSKNAKKTTFNISPQQETFIESLAFGTTLKKIKSQDYEDFQKLLYLPKGKRIK